MSTDQPLHTSRKSPVQPAIGPGAVAKRETLLALDQSESKYRRLIEGISGEYVIYTHSPDGTVTYVSPSVENVLGFPPSKIVGLNWRDLVGERFLGRETADRVRSEVESGKKFHKFTVEMSHADGSILLVEIQQRPLFDEAGEYISMEGIAKDLTETIRNALELEKLKKDLEYRVAERTVELSLKNELLRKSENRYRSVVEDQSEFVVRWLPGGKLTFANGAYCRFYKKNHREIIGVTFLPNVYEEDIPKLENHLRSLTIDHPHGRVRHRVHRPDGSLSWVEWTNRALFDDEGQPQEYQSVGRDITDLKHASDTIREKEAHLAHVSRLATMGELVAGIAHEVHQPLHAAKTFAEAARRSLEAGHPEGVETAIDCTKEISEAISRTARIIRHLREFTKSRPVEFELIDLSTLVHDASEIISYETRRARINLQFELGDSLPPVQGDRVQLEQACINLLMNSYEAMDDVSAQERNLRVETNLSDEFVQLIFCDVGCGIGHVNTTRLFDAFYSTKPGGMGMGLSLCKSIAEAHGGQIWAEENKGPGMSFVLSLPLAKQYSTGSMSDTTDI